MKLSFGFGNGVQEVELPSRNLIGELHANDVPISLRGEAEVVRALRDPIGSQRLRDIVRPGETVAIVTSDLTRPMPTALVMPALLDELYAVNVRGAFLCAREAAKKMISEQSGCIINVSSVWGEVGGSCESAYSATKGALIALTKALAKELGYSGIRVNCVSPGVIDTAMNARLSKEDMAALREEIPLCRIGAPQDVAKAVIGLIESEYVTGADIPVNGGFYV